MVIFGTAAQDRLYINDFSIEAGETKLVEIQLDNTVAYTALQADIYLPEGLSIEQEDDEYLFDLTDRKARNHTISSSDLASGAIRILIASQTLKTFSGNSGALVTFNIIADASYSGAKVIELKNVVATEPDQTEHQLPNTTCTVSGPGGEEPPVVGDDRLYINDFSIEAGETKLVEIQLDNTVAYTALQADIYLPEGLSIEQEDDEYLFDLTDRKARNHTISSSDLASGAIRILIASQTLKTFSGNSGALVTFNIIADASYSGAKVIELKNVVATEPDQTEHQLPNTTCTVTGPGGPSTVLATSISLNQATAEVAEGETLQLTATVLPQDATDRTVTWTSSNTAVATVDANGLVIAVAAGTATITATTNDGTNLTATCAVTVPQPVVVPEALELSEKAFRLKLTQTHQVTVLTEGITDVTWSSSDATIASVDANGVVTAHKNGIAIITATAANGASMWCSVYSYLRGDVDESNSVDVGDVNRVVNIMLGKE